MKNKEIIICTIQIVRLPSGTMMLKLLKDKKAKGKTK
jgi:hypothetical protein